jgi:hypothetical protein
MQFLFSHLNVHQFLGDLFERLPAVRIKIVPFVPGPDLYAVGYADDDHVPFYLGEVLQVLGQQNPALFIRDNLNRSAEQQAVESPGLLLGKRHGLEFILLGTPFLLGEHEKAFIQTPGNEEFFDKLVFCGIAKLSRQNQAAFTVYGMFEFTVKHFSLSSTLLHFYPLSIKSIDKILPFVKKKIP